VAISIGHEGHLHRGEGQRLKAVKVNQRGDLRFDPAWIDTCLESCASDWCGERISNAMTPPLNYPSDSIPTIKLAAIRMVRSIVLATLPLLTRMSS
jgi:hypothetical protein